METLDHAVETIIRESDRALFGTASYDRLLEKWSDAARAAALAARRARRKGDDWRTAARDEFVKTKAGRDALVSSVERSRAKGRRKQVAWKASRFNVDREFGPSSAIIAKGGALASVANRIDRAAFMPKRLMKRVRKAAVVRRAVR